MNRRGFMGAILAAAVAPAIVRADSLMRIVPVDTTALMLDDIYGASFAKRLADVSFLPASGLGVEFKHGHCILYNEKGPIAWCDAPAPVLVNGDTLEIRYGQDSMQAVHNGKIIIDTGKTQEYGGRAYLVDSTAPVSELAPRAGLGTLKIPRLG